MGGEQLPFDDPIRRAGKAAVGLLLLILLLAVAAIVAGLCWRLFQAAAFGSG